MSGDLTIRPGGVADVPAVLELLDKAVRWLVAQNRPGQWGTQPLSAEARHRTRISGWARDGGLYLACLEERPVGALAVGEAPGYVPAVPEPELYVNLLVTDHECAGQHVGGRLLDQAREIARSRGAAVLRVDCYAGDDQALVRYYEREGFERLSPFAVELADGRSWPGQLLQARSLKLTHSHPPRTHRTE
jgi:GNAT superfamily N-acetyltransferase